ncbi:hypothetical protein EVAR_89731_1 [Eumeta japonica]|uniref:Uncharacterized protein n=1 Tax=Eumeta variegata TaxID=151549 RepID=A0A4C1Y3D6_EUMVA|nr:hypothetical protein EVAR_89731_1 [Eumeta japonica]
MPKVVMTNSVIEFPPGASCAAPVRIRGCPVVDVGSIRVTLLYFRKPRTSNPEKLVKNEHSLVLSFTGCVSSLRLSGANRDEWRLQRPLRAPAAVS